MPVNKGDIFRDDQRYPVYPEVDTLIPEGGINLVTWANYALQNLPWVPQHPVNLPPVPGFPKTALEVLRDLIIPFLKVGLDKLSEELQQEGCRIPQTIWDPKLEGLFQAVFMFYERMPVGIIFYPGWYDFTRGSKGGFTYQVVFRTAARSDPKLLSPQSSAYVELRMIECDENGQIVPLARTSAMLINPKPTATGAWPVVPLFREELVPSIKGIVRRKIFVLNPHSGLLSRVVSDCPPFSAY